LSAIILFQVETSITLDITILHISVVISQSVHRI